jgi:hypothetical protein
VDQVFGVADPEQERGGEPPPPPDEARVRVDEIRQARQDPVGLQRVHGGMIAQRERAR